MAGGGMFRMSLDQRASLLSNAYQPLSEDEEKDSKSSPSEASPYRPLRISSPFEDDAAWPPDGSPVETNSLQSKSKLAGVVVDGAPDPAGLGLKVTAKSNVFRETRSRKTTWICINDRGNKYSITADKRAIIQRFRLGIPQRDMRLLDPNLMTSETGKLLVRDNAIVFSMEHVRLIITADLVFIPQSSYSSSAMGQAGGFVEAMEEAIQEWARDADRECFRDAAASAFSFSKEDEDQASESYEDSAFGHQVPPLPFELLTLEVALGAVCRLCDLLVKDLEAIAHPALETLMKQVKSENLERVRKVKTRHQRLLGRVTTVRDELERFLGDDDDMGKLCLTRRKEVEQAIVSGSVPPAQVGSLVTSLGLRRLVTRSESVPITPRPSSASAPQQQQHDGLRHLERLDSSALPPADEAVEPDSLDAVENLLESYFMQIDNVYDKLMSLGEYVQDSEEYINIELDASRNQLIRLEIVLTAATFAIAMYSMVAGVLGENLVIPEGITQDVMGFVEVNVTTTLICLACFMAILCYMRAKRLM